MKSSESSLLRSLPSLLWKTLDECVAAYEHDFHAGKARRLAEYLPPPDSVLPKKYRCAVGIELAKVDLELRFHAGQDPPSDGYLKSLAGYVDANLLNQELAEHIQQLVEPSTMAASIQKDGGGQLANLAMHWTTVSQQWMDGRRPLPPDGDALQPGCRLGDFEIQQLLGEGAFAKVYLARQISLNRRVALKISANQGAEAKTLAPLEHDHIVRVFSETIDPTNTRIICMQYVAGATLAAIIQQLHPRKRNSRQDSKGLADSQQPVSQPQPQTDGRRFLEAVESLSCQPEELHNRGVEDRQTLHESDLTQTVCWIGERLADALAYAHSQGVLHRDIKPANILVDQYGRPYLADFNLSLDRRQEDDAHYLGGTFAYMSPEHLEAMIDYDQVAIGRVDHRSDIYALGVVLFELATGRRPYPFPSQKKIDQPLLQEMARLRRVSPASPRRVAAQVSPALDRIIRRCLAADPNDRYQSAEELMRALSGARQMQSIDRSMPPPGRLTGAALAHPLAMKFVLDFSPHIIGAALNILYIVTYIYQTLSPSQQKCYHFLAPMYTLFAFAATFYFAWRLCGAQVETWKRLRSEEDISESEAVELRSKARSGPLWGVAVSCAGWFPGVFFFPLGLLLAGEDAVTWHLWVHFGVIFLIAGLISLTYSYFSAEFFLLRVNYPPLLADSPTPQTTAWRELLCVRRRLRWFQILTGAIPLLTAVLVIFANPHVSQQFEVFRFLLAVLILLGVLGGAMSAPIANTLAEYHTVLAGADPRRAAVTMRRWN